MNTSHICLACRRTIRRTHLYKSLKWQPRASFQSLVQPAEATTPEEDGIRELAEEPRIPLQRREKPKPQRKPDDAGDALESMFEETLNRGAAADAQRTHDPAAALDLYKHIQMWKKKLGDGEPLSDCWAFLVEHFGPAAWKSGEFDVKNCPATLKVLAPQFFRALIDAKKKDPFSKELPSASEITLVSYQLGVLDGRSWAGMMTVLLESILREGILASHELQLDLLQSWNIVGRPFKSLTATVEVNASYLDWSHTVNRVSRLQQEPRWHGVQGTFGVLTPSIPRAEMKQLPMIAIGTLKVLLDVENLEKTGIAKSGLPNADPLMTVIAKAITDSGMGADDLNGTLERAPPLLNQYIIDGWTSIQKFTTQKLPKPVFRKLDPAVRNLNAAPSDRESGYLHRSLRDALKRKDIRMVQNVWLQAQQLPIWKPENVKAQSLDSQGFYRGHLTHALYNYFIFVFMALRQPAGAIEVWNHMVSNDLVPEVGAWNSMLMGCKTARDSEALEGVWKKMIDSGVIPDSYCWTSRISGLIDCHKSDLAIRVLDQMGRIWLQEARRIHGKTAKVEHLRKVNDLPRAIKPTIATVNAAIAGLVKRRDEAMTQQVLSWAEDFGIKPDTFTYNTLMRPLIRDGKISKAQALLRNMQRQGINADVGTFTTVLEETLRDAHLLSQSERLQLVKSVFDTMEGAGVTPNEFTFGRIISSLLQSNPNDHDSVTAVMQRMVDRNVKISPHIYTMLITHYFQQEPPNLQAVSHLIERSRLHLEGVDHIFWDRVIAGYAQAGETTTALRYLGKLYNEKNTASWTTLRTLLWALVENDRWDDAQELVKNTYKDSGGPIDRNAKGAMGQHMFWELAAELNLLQGMEKRIV